MTSYRNIDITHGIPSVLEFPIVDTTGLKIDLTDHTFRLDVYNSLEKLIFTKSVTYEPAQLGLVKIQLTETDIATFISTQYTYRFTIIDPALVPSVAYRGFITIEYPSYDPDEEPIGSPIILPDGTIYLTGLTEVTPNVWYALSGLARFTVKDLGVIVIDGRDLHGTVWGNTDAVNSTSFEPVMWFPDLAGMTAFRVKQVSGAATVTYIP